MPEGKILPFPNRMTPVSRVISVRLTTGCYRHLRLPSSATLEDLSDAILWAFGFTNDHAHAFFLDNLAWSDKNSYFDIRMDVDERLRHTCDCKLDILLPKQRFKYVFDFGENWVFSCQLLREEEDCDDIELVRVCGEAPPQYDPSFP